ncbi:oxidoreductase [Parafrankia colletiae]|uniref:Oxidoreductase n=1 Tax=Parafrankia colletiae TaxID=573497 RepID=A0A1S1QDJ5_9ACTN|nr:Gfo/Idh/MocA family oxidoreductase [Parafrankia colletiae]MCK9901933.1 Gfo/Idh/MocA family oxidoreductase [Frankia sp. Cpl3]OHV32883.1 oxidoreductase [Parafrankia colletiae]
MSTQRLRIGVLGCADIAWRRMLPALAANPDVELTAVASRDAAKAQRFAERFGGEPVVGYSRLLDRPDVDAVYIPLPPGLHAAWVERALRSGRHVLAEKPLTTSRADSERLTALAETSGLALLESLMFLTHSQHATVRDLVGTGEIGTVRGLTAQFAFPATPARGRHSPEVGGGALTDVGVYPLRTALLFLGDELEVVGATLRVDEQLGVDIAGDVLLATPTGVTAHLTFGTEHAYRARYELWGSTGRIAAEWAFTPPPTHPPVIRIERQNRIEKITLAADDQFGNVVAAFVARVRDGVPSVLEGKAVLAQADLIDRVRDSALVLPRREGTPTGS